MEIRIEESECSLSDREQLVNNEVAEDSVNISVASSDENLEGPESTTTVTYRGKRKYIAPDIFEDVVPIKIKALPQDINISVYIVQLSKDRTLKNCKGGRPWGNIQSSRLKLFTAGPRLLMNCRGSYRCHNVHCKNLLDFGVSRKDFVTKNDLIVCMICGIEAIYVPCESRLIREQDLKKETVTCKHYGSHTCPSNNIQQIDCSVIKEIAKGLPKLTREGFIRQKIQNCLEEKSYKSAVGTARILKNTNSIDNIKKRVKKMRRPDGHSFEAIRIIQESFNKEDIA